VDKAVGLRVTVGDSDGDVAIGNGYAVGAALANGDAWLVFLWDWQRSGGNGRCHAQKQSVSRTSAVLSTFVDSKTIDSSFALTDKTGHR
jgi:hypothetical protein